MNTIKSKKYSLKESLVTDEEIYFNRRKFLLGVGSLLMANYTRGAISNEPTYNEFSDIVDRPLTKLEVLSRYNNFFEFGTSKEIWKSAQKLNVSNWSIEIKGGKYNKKKIDYDFLIRHFALEERIYKFRCVEAWSMVVPWYGFELSKLIDFLEPESSVKYVSFLTFYDTSAAKNQKQSWYPWPYREIVTIEEARNVLSFVATGVYGKDLPKQNGAPLRLVFPWKYGFKSIKSIVKIEFLKERKKSFWENIAPEEYGFWANVNPNIPHRRWSQKTEKDLGSGNRFPTQIFNGYEKWVSYLYKDFDIKEKKLFI